MGLRGAALLPCDRVELAGRWGQRPLPNGRPNSGEFLKEKRPKGAPTISDFVSQTVYSPLDKSDACGEAFGGHERPGYAQRYALPISAYASILPPGDSAKGGGMIPFVKLFTELA